MHSSISRRIVGRRFGVLILALAVVAGTVHIPASARQAAAKQSEGYRLYVVKGCFECHGYVGQGSIMSGPALIPNPVSLAAMEAYLRAPTGQMPPYSEAILSGGEIAQIRDYLLSIPKSPPPQQIPLLPQIPAAAPARIQGSAHDIGSGSVAALYVANCANCHGAAGEGGAGPDLRSETRKRDLAATVEIILSPPGSMPRLYPSVLSHRQVEDLAAYIRLFH